MDYSSRTAIDVTVRRRSYPSIHKAATTQVLEGRQTAIPFGNRSNTNDLTNNVATRTIQERHTNEQHKRYTNNTRTIYQLKYNASTAGATNHPSCDKSNTNDLPTTVDSVSLPKK